MRVIALTLTAAAAFALAGCNTPPKHERTAEDAGPVVEEASGNRSLDYGFDFSQYHVVEGSFKPGDVLSKVLLPLGVTPADLELLVGLSKPVFDVRRIQPQKKWVTLFEHDSADTPSFFILEKNLRDYVVFSIRDSLAVWEDRKPSETVKRVVRGTIEHSLSKSMAEVEAPVDLAIELSSIYAWTIDFYRLQKGDGFELLYEEERVDGARTGRCTILACTFLQSGRERKAYRFESEDGADYYDEHGESLRKAFLKAPVKYSRISSRFTGRRFHPVLKTYKAHLGTDYAAPHGTPIMAVGDGTVTAAAFTSGNGNYVKIRHNSVYETQYLHMSKRAVKNGQQVKQGEVIGYVGSTGLATGPHVCFRFWKNGQQIDHLREEFPSAEPIHEALFDDFMAKIAEYNQSFNESNEPEIDERTALTVH